jgi:hypothetical protein
MSTMLERMEPVTEGGDGDLTFMTHKATSALYWSLETARKHTSSCPRVTFDCLVQDRSATKLAISLLC